MLKTPHTLSQLFAASSALSNADLDDLLRRQERIVNNVLSRPADQPSVPLVPKVKTDTTLSDKE